MSRRGSNGTNMRFEARRHIDPARHWYAVATTMHAERNAAMEFVGNDVAIWLPHYRALTIRRNRKVEASGLFFPGYLFAGIAPDRKGGTDVLFRNRFVADVLRDNGKPLRLSPPIIQAVADRLTGDVKSERMAAAAALHVGEIRRISRGPFASFLAEITELLASGRVRVDVSIFGRATPLELDPDYLDAA